jgi:hypothetical protein
MFGSENVLAFHFRICHFHMNNQFFSNKEEKILRICSITQHTLKLSHYLDNWESQNSTQMSKIKPLGLSLDGVSYFAS